MFQKIRRALIGQPIPTERAHHEKLSKLLALPVFASDNMSSSAYATEEIMAALLIAGTSYFYLTPPISLAIILLLVVIVTSYRQTVMAYPTGGGAYIVSKENLGDLPAEAAAAALLVDYVLTVSVSIAAGIAAITSLLQNYGHDLTPFIVPLCLLATSFVALMNLRGVRESGVAFALPSYSFVAIMYVMLGIGFYKLMQGGLPLIHSAAELQAARIHEEHAGHAMETLRPMSLFLLLHAFSSGCTALTGAEAISNGVPAFRPPESRNAATTMTWMGIILGTLFLSLSYLAIAVNALPPNAEGYEETVLSQVGRAIFGTGALYLLLQVATCAILVLAANTAFADFPRLCSLMARDGFLPRQLNNIGDKLVFNNGIHVLTALSCLLVILFHGSVHYLIPLYCVGVFLSFTLSQAGMVKHWFQLKGPGWQWKAAINGFGAVATCIVMIVFGIVKFADGAWIVVLLIPVLVAVFSRIKAHYRSVARQLSLEGYRPHQGMRHHVLVLAPDIHRGVIPALQYARTISEDAKALHVAIDPARENRVKERFTLWSRGMPLVILPSPYRSLYDPIVEYIARLQEQEPNSLITLVIPEFVPTGWWPNLLHGQAGLFLSLRFRFWRGVVVTTVPYHIEAFLKSPEAKAGRKAGWDDAVLAQEHGRHGATHMRPPEAGLTKRS